MHRGLANKRESYFGKDASGVYDGTKHGLRDLGSEKFDGKAEVDGTGPMLSGKYSSVNPTPDGLVGYVNLPNQVYRRAVRRGFEFNMIVVGESGLGKSTFVNSIFLTDLYNAEHPGPSKRLKKTVYVEPTTVVLKENGVHVKLTLIDTPGFGDAVDNSNCWQPLLDYIDARYDEYLTAESRVYRSPQGTADHRVHACLYFIAPTGHGLKPLDIEFMRRIQDKVNVIPVIGKADTLTPEECRDFKKTISNELLLHKIRIYEFPDMGDAPAGGDDEGGDLTKLSRLKDRAPFAVVGANAVLSGGKVRGRVYPWGTVEVDNLEHNDFIALRNLLLRVHMQDLKEVTSTVHYENYRHAKLSGIAQEGKFATKDGKDPMSQMEAEKKDHEAKMKKMEAEMEQVFEQKVKEKRQKLKESEADIQRRSEQMKKQLEQQESELEETRRNFEAERNAWESGGGGGGAGNGADNGMRGGDPESIGSATGASMAAAMAELSRDKSKTEKKKKGLF